MKTKLDQISIPPLCRGMSELGHTLVVKQCLCNWRSWLQTPVGANYWTTCRVKDTMGNFLFLFFFVFLVLCFCPL